MFKEMAKKVLGTVFGKSLPPPSGAEKEFLSELQTTFQKLPVLETTDSSPSETAWKNNMNRLRELVLKQDAREFLRWDVISKTMFVDNAGYIPAELKYLTTRPDWDARWREAIKESTVGHPKPLRVFPASSGNLIHHAYHLAQFEEKTKVPVHEIECVFEFGGGYGSMCRLFFNLGFRGKYVIFDLPSFSALQVYFLKTLGLPVKSLADFKKSDSGIVCVSDIADLPAALTDHRQINSNLFLATWSISESPMRIRESILPLVSDFQSFLIAYQERFGEVDNLEFFDNWKQTLGNVIWHNWPIEHIPGNNYLIGNRSYLEA